MRCVRVRHAWLTVAPVAHSYQQLPWVRPSGGGPRIWRAGNKRRVDSTGWKTRFGEGVFGRVDTTGAPSSLLGASEFCSR